MAPRFAERVPEAVRLHRIGSPARVTQSHLLLGETVANYAPWLCDLGVRRWTAAERIAHAEAVARKSLDARMDVRAFAAAAALNPSRFHEVYLRERRETPHRFLQRARLERAASLLRAGQTDVATVAAIVGYADGTSFGRAFRRTYRCSPTEYRQGLQ